MAANYSLDSLIADLKKNTYTPKTEAELQAVADTRYKSVYDQKRLEAQQAADLGQLAMDRQIAGIGTLYGKQKEASAQQYTQAYSQANRQATYRGMQRSSFNNATLGNIAISGNKAQQEIADQEALNRTGIENQKTLLARQLSDQIKQYSASQAADTLAYLDELEQNEYDRSTTAADKSNSLAMQIYQFANQEKQQEEAQTQWLKQFNEQIRQYDSSLTEQARQYNESLTEQKRATDLDSKYNYDQLEENTRQFDKQLAESTRQFEAQQAQSARQFNASLTEQQRQYDLNTAEGKRQFDASLNQQQKQMLEDIRQFDTQLAENQSQFNILHPAKKSSGSKTGSGITLADIVNNIISTGKSIVDPIAYLLNQTVKAYDNKNASTNKT
jgi:hypothetical protein